VTSPPVPVLLSTSSVFPEPTSAGFDMAASLGYDGVEVMVWTDPVSQDLAALRGLSDHYGVRVGSVHAPCLLVTQRVWSPDPWERLRRSAVLATELGAPTVVVHPPFTWQREYARGFTGWDPTKAGFDAYTLDLSHCAAARNDAMVMADAMGAGLRHVHLGDGTGEGRDEHLVPGRGSQPCARLLNSLAGRGFQGSVAVEVSTRRARSRADRQQDLAEALRFARRHLSTSSTSSTVDAGYSG
jgi:sugar phosphate isomerase/epimerase